MAIRSPKSSVSVSRRLAERARAAREAEQPSPESVDIGGIFGHLRGLAEQFASVVKQAGGDGHTVQMGGDKTKMVFGYTVRFGDGAVDAEPFGHVSPEPAQAMQPITEVFADGDAVVVVAELPGAEADSIACRADGNRLTIEATGARRYRKELKLPAPVQGDSIQQSYRNGILEVRMIKAQA